MEPPLLRVAAGFLFVDYTTECTEEWYSSSRWSRTDASSMACSNSSERPWVFSILNNPAMSARFSGKVYPMSRTFLEEGIKHSSVDVYIIRLQK